MLLLEDIWKMKKYKVIKIEELKNERWFREPREVSSMYPKVKPVLVGETTTGKILVATGKTPEERRKKFLKYYGSLELYDN